jgi:hypothetical protein
MVVFLMLTKYSRRFGVNDKISSNSKSLLRSGTTIPRSGERDSSFSMQSSRLMEAHLVEQLLGLLESIGGKNKSGE